MPSAVFRALSCHLGFQKGSVALVPPARLCDRDPSMLLHSLLYSPAFSNHPLNMRVWTSVGLVVLRGSVWGLSCEGPSPFAACSPADKVVGACRPLPVSLRSGRPACAGVCGRGSTGLIEGETHTGSHTSVPLPFLSCNCSRFPSFN